jgi:C-terminal processing protease CtpA/Prc
MRTHLAAGPLLFIASLAQAQTNAREASAEATSYLEAALDQIEQGSRVYATDWEAMRAKARSTIAAAGAKTTADTYQAIRDALATLGDKHGLLLDPAAAKLFNPGRTPKATGLLVVPPDALVALVVPGSPAAAAGLALGDRIVAVEGLAGFAELPRREFERLFRSGRRLDGSTAPLDLRVRTGPAEPRAVEVPRGRVPLKTLSSIDEPTPCECLELPAVKSFVAQRLHIAVEIQAHVGRYAESIFLIFAF